MPDPGRDGGAVWSPPGDALVFHLPPSTDAAGPARGVAADVTVAAARGGTGGGGRGTLTVAVVRTVKGTF